MNHIKPGFLIKTYKQVSVIWQAERGLGTTKTQTEGKQFFPLFILSRHSCVSTAAESSNHFFFQVQG